jgi:transposase
MGQNFLSCDREQAMLLPPCVADWLPADHFARFVIDAVDALDLSGIVGAYRADGSGRAAHDPAMMVALVFYCYADGVCSSRAIERRCVEDVPCRVIAANRTPDHVTIARFRQRHAAALSGLFDQVLELCARAGLVSAGTIAIDGTKLRANAALGANRSYRAIAQELLERAERVDAEEDEWFGERRGDELPAALSDPQTRRERLREAKRQMDAERAAAQEEYEDLVARRTEVEQRTGRPARGRKPKPPDQRHRHDRPSQKRNVTDPDSRIVRDCGRLIQGYNAQVVVGSGRVILAAEVTNSPTDGPHLGPMTDLALQALARLGSPPPDTVLADGSYWNQQMIGRLVDDGIEVLIPPHGPKTIGPQARKRPRQGPDAQRIARMLQTPDGQARYRQRAAMVEPVFADTKHNRQITRLLRRGLQAARDEFALIATTHNLRRLYFAGLQAA